MSFTYRLFAPTDTAFASMDPNELAAILDPTNLTELIALLTYHVVPSAQTYSHPRTPVHPPPSQNHPFF